MTRAGLHSWFSEDDLMNLWFARYRGVQALLQGLIVFFGPYTRPLGQAWYLSLYSLVGLEPAAFNVARWVIVALDAVLLYLFVSRISNSRSTGRLALVLGGCHAALFAMYFDSGMIYDLLAFLFYYLTLWRYVGIRRQGRVPGIGELAGLTVLYIGALDAKEIAVTLPVAVLFYELVMERVRFSGPAGAVRAVLREGRFVLASGTVTLAYVIGKVWTGALYSLPSYHPEFSLHNYLQVYGQYLLQFLNRPGTPSCSRMLLLLGGSVVLAAISRRRVLLWASLFNLFSVLPIAFIVARTAFAFYIPLAGWAVFLAGLLEWLGEGLARAAGRVAHLDPGVRRAVAHGAVLLAVVAFTYPQQARLIRAHALGCQQQQFRLRGWYEDIRPKLPEAESGSRFLVLREPPGLSWNMDFLIGLAYRDCTHRVDTVERLKQKGLRVDFGQYLAGFDYQDGHFCVLDRGALVALAAPESIQPEKKVRETWYRPE